MLLNIKKDFMIRKIYTCTYKNNIEGGVVAKPGIATGSRSYNGQL
jgi:hypothetical protein